MINDNSKKKKEKKKRNRVCIWVALVMVAMLGISAWNDYLSNQENPEDGIERPIQGEQEVQLNLDAEGVFDNYSYDLLLKEKAPTIEEAHKYLERAYDEIDNSIFNGENANKVSGNLLLKNEYVEGNVKARWSFIPDYYFDEEGKRLNVEVSQQGEPISASVELESGPLKEVYCFDFYLFPSEDVREDDLIEAINQEIEENSDYGEKIYLPTNVNGTQLTWSVPKEHMVIKVLILEAIIIVLLFYSKREKKRKLEEQRKNSLIQDYPEIVGNMAILLSAGMTIRQAWNKLSARYISKRRNKTSERREGYELLVLGNRELEDGESERNIYKLLGERGGIMEYRRLSRLLSQNLSKGNNTLVGLLEKESENAFETKKKHAIKLGEEAGTKLLIPMILMLGIVLAIVIAPAMISFKG